jgi:3-phosphoshikimate 1-carboxyvinyltransferase
LGTPAPRSVLGRSDPTQRDASMRETAALSASRPLLGTARVPADKAISHRAAILAALAPGRSVVHNFSASVDCAATLRVLRALGVRIDRSAEFLEIQGRGIDPLAPPAGAGPLDCGRSATTMRLTAGVLAARPGRVVLTGDPQLLARPMDRIARPLRRMGATVGWHSGGDLEVTGARLKGIEHRPEVPSAQVKSCVLLAGLHADGRTTVLEAVPTRDHTERLLEAMGASVGRESTGHGVAVSVHAQPLHPIDMRVPGDASSAAVIAAGAAIVPGSDVVTEAVGLNPTRTGFLTVLQRMGVDIELEVQGSEPERVGTIRVRHGTLSCTTVDRGDVPGMVDELPLLALVATQAEGTTEVRGAADLRNKESDRIKGSIEGLRALGADVEELPDGFVVHGPTPLTGGRCSTQRDHRLAMMFRLAGLIASGPVQIEGLEYVADSFPGFEAALEALR